MSQYHKIQNALDSYLEQEKECDKLGEALNNYNDVFMGEKVGSGKEISTLERDLRNSEAALSHALANLTRIVPDDVCPIDLINRYTEDIGKGVATIRIMTPPGRPPFNQGREIVKEDIGDGLSILGFFLMIGMVALGFSGCHAKTEVARIKYEATQ